MAAKNLAVLLQLLNVEEALKIIAQKVLVGERHFYGRTLLLLEFFGLSAEYAVQNYPVEQFVQFILEMVNPTGKAEIVAITAVHALGMVLLMDVPVMDKGALIERLAEIISDSSFGVDTRKEAVISLENVAKTNHTVWCF